MSNSPREHLHALNAPCLEQPTHLKRLDSPPAEVHFYPQSDGWLIQLEVWPDGSSCGFATRNRVELLPRGGYRVRCGVREGFAVLDDLRA